MTALQDRVLCMLIRESLIPNRGRVLIALSGGADSVALTHLLSELAPVAGFSVAGVVHLNHQLRDAAEDDEAFCRALAARLSLPIVIRRADVRRTSERAGISIEEAGHRERHAFFRQTALELEADRVATAHSRHDLAETYLMRLLRGAGPVGLSAIHPRSGLMIRPLLDVSRTELRAYVAAGGHQFREDESNRDLSVTRNRVRHELIPFLEDRFSPSVVDTLVRDAKIARHDAEWLALAADAVASEIMTVTDGLVSLDRELLSRQPVALARRVAKHALERASGRTVGFVQVERLLALADDGESSRIEVDAPGCRIGREGRQIVIRGPLPRARPAHPPGFVYQLAIPGEVDVPEAGLALSVERVGWTRPASDLTAGGGAVLVDGKQLTDPLSVRSWLPGDVFRPLGLGGRKKLQDLFVDRKVHRASRHRVPIVADNRRGIVWVVGHAVADDFRVTPGTEGMLLLRARKLDAN